jgi:hypothetical protein
MNIKIIDNFLNKKYFKFLNENFLNPFFPWYYQNGKAYENDNGFQHTHLFFDNNKINSHHFYLIEKLLTKLSVKSLVRIKLNMEPKNKVIKSYSFHKDNDCNCNTAILYMNTNNGKTLFKDKKINSVENRIVIFNSNIEHTGTSTTNANYRMVLNLNYF